MQLIESQLEATSTLTPGHLQGELLIALTLMSIQANKGDKSLLIDFMMDRVKDVFVNRAYQSYTRTISG